jgi:hypothetical protein
VARPVTLFTGQWADLSLAELAPKVKAIGLQRRGTRLLGRPFEPDRARAEPDYCRKKWTLLANHRPKCFAISTHLIGHAVYDLI